MTHSIGPEGDVFVVGAGIMGIGIAQVAAQAGHRVRLFDAREGAAAAACAQLARTLDGLVAKGRIDASEAQAISARVQAVSALSDAAGSGLVVEAIVENADAKRALFTSLDAIAKPG
ncbi:MAG TPA: 3-hydroxyacyl-CoA dehydrogenase NAD-binding domain-containing protein, partial [Caldimonas sp.]|nr:3-hydroxyacyl-CoA dehydrogenase NAD-binding domain-containing protein [Caldimonas sp.]